MLSKAEFRERAKAVSDGIRKESACAAAAAAAAILALAHGEAPACAEAPAAAGRVKERGSSALAAPFNACLGRGNLAEANAYGG